MKKKLALALMLSAAVFSQAAEEKPEVVFTGTPWSTMGISGNGRYIVGTRQYTEAYRFDVQEGRLFIAKTTGEYDDMCFADVTDDGMIVGKSSDMLPAIYNTATNEWEHLEVPHTGITEGYANEVTPDGKTIVGYVMGSIDPTKPYTVFPCVWRLQSDGTYQYEDLPNPDTDFFGTKTQFISTRTISADGNTVVGVMVEKKGRFYQPIIYRYNGSEWTYEMPFVELTFKGGPQEYAEWMAKEPNMYDYITVDPSDPEYMDQVEEYQAIYTKWQYDFWTAFRTGFEVTSVPVITSTNGKWLAPMATETTWGWKEGDLSIRKESSKSYPILYNLETGEITKFEDIKSGFYTYGVSNDGDMISSDGNDFYLKPAGETKKIELGDWLKREYGFDLRSELPSNTEYIDCCTVSPDMKLIVGCYRSVTPDGELDSKEVFCIKLPGFMNSIMETLNTPVNTSIALAGDELRFGAEAEDICIYDMGGKQVLSHTGKANTLSVANLHQGVYVVTAKIGNEIATGKVYKF